MTSCRRLKALRDGNNSISNNLEVIKFLTPPTPHLLYSLFIKLLLFLWHQPFALLFLMPSINTIVRYNNIKEKRKMAINFDYNSKMVQ